MFLFLCKVRTADTDIVDAVGLIGAALTWPSELVWMGDCDDRGLGDRDDCGMGDTRPPLVRIWDFSEFRTNEIGADFSILADLHQFRPLPLVRIIGVLHN